VPAHQPEVGKDENVANDRNNKSRTMEPSFGKVLASLRKEQGMSQQELADSAGYSLRYIGDLERGTKSPTLRTMQHFAVLLNVPLSTLILEAEKLMKTGHRLRKRPRQRR